ncbi:MAG TPA: hypothetical protein VFS17_01230, partial [Methylophilaceae bacterium]|nr:hypothetical protein [Methylophilaceae bacterium]
SSYQGLARKHQLKRLRRGIAKKVCVKYTTTCEASIADSSPIRPQANFNESCLGLYLAEISGA